MRKILIVDDSPFLRNSLKQIFSRRPPTKEALEIVEADTREKAIQEFEKQDPDLVLLDIVLREGEREGVKVLEQIRKTKTPVLVLTAVGQESIIEECKRLGIEGYILKPFDDEEVVKAVAKCLAS